MEGDIFGFKCAFGRHVIVFGGFGGGGGVVVVGNIVIHVKGKRDEEGGSLPDMGYMKLKPLILRLNCAFETTFGTKLWFFNG
jgi:hypothetical protein